MLTAVLIQSHKNSDYIYEIAKINPTIRFYVHIDKKNSFDYLYLKDINLNNIILVVNRIEVNWAAPSQIQATLLLLELAFQDKRNQFFHLISAECLPLKSFQEIENEWKKNPESNFIESHRSSSHDWRLRTKVYHCETKLFRTFLGKFFNKLFKFKSYFYTNTKISKCDYYFGSQWFSINRSMVEFFLDLHSKNYFELFKKISCADEHAFAIASRKKDNSFVKDNNKRLIIFNGKASPIYLSEDILKANYGKYWFARKISHDLLLKLIKGKS